MLTYDRINQGNNINTNSYINVIKMNFNIWLKRLFIIFLLITSLLVAVVIGSKSKTNKIVSETKQEETIWSPSQMQFISQSGKEGKTAAQRLPNSIQSTELEIKSVIQKSKGNKQSENNSTTNKVAENKALNQKQSSQKESSNKQNQIHKKNQIQVQQLPKKKYQTTKYFQEYKPKYTVALADPSNYGDRYLADINGSPLNNQAIVVLHETSNSASSAINTFKTHHTDDSQQVSYHALITLDGTVVYLVPPDKRAYGAGNSVFEGVWGIETVQTNPNLPPSVNNFAYHVSLETPPDAHGKYKYKTHSGYTDSQYKSLAWLIAQSEIPDARITTHREVDRSGQRIDPRSFDFNKFLDLLHRYRQPVAITPKQGQEATENLVKRYNPA